MKALLFAHAAATLFMTGLIWFVQCVHYPLFARIGGNDFMSYHAAHASRTTAVVLPPMLVELVTAVALWLHPPGDANRVWLTAGLVLLAVIWSSTALLQVPTHRGLSRGFDRSRYRQLVATNWLRTACWSLRAVIALGLLGSPSP